LNTKGKLAPNWFYLLMAYMHQMNCNCKPKFSLPGPPRPGDLHGPASQGPRPPLHGWPPVKSAPGLIITYDYFLIVCVIDFFVKF